jgi:hypothetical protein
MQYTIDFSAPMLGGVYDALPVMDVYEYSANAIDCIRC